MRIFVHFYLIFDVGTENDSRDRYLSDSVDLLVYLCTVMVTLLTRSGYREANTSRMPSTNTRHLAQTFVRLTWQLLTIPPAGDACNSKTI